MLQRGAFLIEGCRAALGVTSLQPGWLPGVMGVGIPWNKYGVGDGPCRGDAVYSCYILSPIPTSLQMATGCLLPPGRFQPHGCAAQCCPRGHL